MAKKAEIKAKLSLDKSAFSRGIKAAKAEALAFAGALGRGIKGVISSPLAAIGGLLAGAFSVGAFASGVKGALELGDTLENLKARTGESVDKLLIFREVLKANGIEAEQAGTLINKMQASVSQAADNGELAYQTFGRWGVSIKDILALSPVEQFRAIHDAIAKISSAANRAYAARKIFGRGGGEILGAHFNSKGFEDATKSLGSQAKILADNSKAFEVVAQRLNRAGLKLQGFFIGVASTILPALEKFSGMLDSGDLAAAGQKFGAYLEKGVELLVGAFMHPEKVLSAFFNYYAERTVEGWNMMANAAIMFGKIQAGALITAFGEATAFLGAGLEWVFNQGTNLFKTGMGGAVEGLGNAILNGFKVGIDFLVAGIKSAWDWTTDNIPKAFAAAQKAIAPKGENKGGESFAQTFARYQKSDLIQYGKNLMGAKMGDTDFFGAAKFKQNTKEAIDAMAEAGRIWIEARNKVAGDKTGFQSSSTLTRSDTGGIVPASMAGALAKFKDKQSPGFKGVFSSSLDRSAFNQTPILNARERRAMENAAVARGERRSVSFGAYSAVRSGDHKRAKEFAKSEARKALTTEGTNERLDVLIDQVKPIKEAFGP